jgi:hypothetical protein
VNPTFWIHPLTYKYIIRGVPCIRGFRIPVATIIGMFAEGMSYEEILKLKLFGTLLFVLMTTLIYRVAAEADAKFAIFV